MTSSKCKYPCASVGNAILTSYNSFFDVAEVLMTLSLVKRNKDTKAFSIHRLVQTQYRYHIQPKNGQEASEGATMILYAAFSSIQKNTSQLYEHWAQCRLLLQHILALKENYKKESTGPEPLKPTQQFCRLLSNCSRWVATHSALLLNR